MPDATRKVVTTTTQPARVMPAAEVTSRVSRAAIQPAGALTVSSPKDPAEREAESTAARIVRMPAPEGAYGSSDIARFRPAADLIRRQRIDRSAASEPSPPRVSSETAADIRNTAAAGSELPGSVRHFMEPRFGADFSGVRMHTGDRAASLSRQLNAQAFTVGNQVFFGRGRFQPETSEGKELIAHELTHTIQQGAAVQRAPDAPVEQRSPGSVQRLGLSDALDYFADKANFIPGFRMFTIVLGVNPINMSRVERSAANVLRAVVEFMPGGALITQALDNLGVFERVGGWVEQQLRSLAMTGAMFRQAIDRFLDSLGWSDIFSLGSVWERAKRIVTEPIGRLIDFAKGLITGILGFIKDAILKPLARMAEGSPGYDLLKAVLGQDPITGEPVPRNAETLIGGLMKLIGQEEIWLNIKRSNAVARAWAWFQGALAGLMGFVRQIPALFLAALRSLEIVDLVVVHRAFMKVASVFSGVVGRFLEWAGQQVMSLLQIIFEVVAPGVMPYIRKAAAAFRTIVKDPIAFIRNLVRAGIQGFQQFASNFLVHLKTSLINWLTGTLAGANIYIPQSFTLKEIIKFVLSVLGLTWQNLRTKLVRVVGETAVRALETGFDIVVTLVTEGPAAAWEKIREGITNLREMVMEQIMNFVRDRIVEAAIKQLIMSLNPAGAFIQAIMAIYNTIMFVVERLKQIGQVVAAFIDSMSAIASGAIAAAANRVEQTMGGLLTLVISFLARLVGLGKVSDAIGNIVARIRAPIDRALDRVIEWIVAGARKLGKLVVKAGQKLVSWWKMRKEFTADGEAHAVFFRGEGAAAQLIVASNELPIEAFLSQKETEFKGDATKLAAIATVRTKLAAIKTKIGKLDPGKEDEQAQKEIENELNAMAPALIALLSSTDWGSEANPSPLEYQKRRAQAYPTFYLGKGATASWDQDQLRLNYGKPAYKTSIWRYVPLSSEKTPGGERTLGLVGASQLDVGTKFKFDNVASHRGGQVGAFKDVVIKYGLRPKDHGWDVDHVIELQIGGQDDFKNLWPLPLGENRSSGSLIKDAETTVPGKPKALKIGDALVEKRKKTKKNSDALWLMITTTRQR